MRDIGASFIEGGFQRSLKRMVCILMGCVSVWNVMGARTYIFSTIAEALYAEMDKNAKEPWPTSW